MGKKKLIIGNHPLASNLIQQYRTRDTIVEHQTEMSALDVNMSDFDELYLLTNNDVGSDDDTITALSQLITGYEIDAHGGKKLTCHLLLQSNKTLQMLQTTDFCDAIKKKADVYPFTMEEIWSHSIVLDREPITMQSDKHVHLVIFGMDELAQMVAIQAAHVAHYPNYVRNHSLRTRITMISENAEAVCKGFMERYQHLFDNSFYRIVKPSEEKAVKVFHKPMYDGKREDFVDVEWEFVEAESWNAEVREKLKLWAQDHEQLLTVVMAERNVNRNVAMSLVLPNELYQHAIPIYNYCPTSEYDISMPLVQMAKIVNYIYDRCYNENVKDWKGLLRYTVEINKEDMESSWAKLSNVKRMSSIYNAMTIPTKMRSLGLKEDDWDQFYDITQQDIELLAQVEHNRWSVEELILGFRPCSDEEQEKIAEDVKKYKDEYKARKIHYDLRAYNDLRPDGTGKPVQIYDLCLSACLPLIAKAYADEKGGDA